MKIKSNYVDYYDKIASIYGGGDPKIVYVRPYTFQEFPEIEPELVRLKGRFRDSYKAKSLNSVSTLFSRHNWSRHYRGIVISEEITDFRVIIIGNILFTQIKKKGDADFRLVRESDLRNPEKKKEQKTKYHTHRYYDYKEVVLTLDDVINCKDDELINLCKSVGYPVFTINLVPIRNNSYRMDINNVMPHLGRIGIGNFIDANTMYQNLSYLIGNLMRDCPDMMPPIEVSDKVKIEGHGFDYKTSFRGKLVK